MNLDIGKAFTYISEDPNWVTKLLIGGGLVLAFPFAFITIVGWIPIGLIISGYCIQLTRNVIRGEQYPLPEWTDWGNRMLDGLKAWLVGFAYALPATIISLAFSLPSILNSVSQAVSGKQSSSGLSAATSGLSSFGSCISWLVGVVVGLFLPIALGRYAASSDLAQAFQFGAVFATLRANFVTYLIIALINGIVLKLVTGIGLLAICIGIAFTWFYSQTVLFYLYGLAHRQAQGVSTGMGQPPQPSYPF